VNTQAKTNKSINHPESTTKKLYLIYKDERIKIEELEDQYIVWLACTQSPAHAIHKKYWTHRVHKGRLWLEPGIACNACGLDVTVKNGVMKDT